MRKGGQVYEVIQSVANKTYSKCACAEAVSDIDALMTALQRLRYHCDVDATLNWSLFDDVNYDADGGLPSRVRELVADAKNLVGGALSSSAERQARLGVLVNTTMHTLAAVFMHCCRSVVTTTSSSGGGVADQLVDAARSLRTTVAAASELLDADRDETPGAVDSSKTALLATAESLAKSLKLLVHEVKTV